MVLLLNVGISYKYADFSVTNIMDSMTFIPSNLLLLNSHSLDIRIRSKQQAAYQKRKNKMDDEFNPRLRTILARLFKAIKTKLSANTFIADLQRQRDKCTKSKELQLVLIEFTKVDKLSAQIYKAQVQDDMKAEILAIECLKRFLKAYDDVRRNRKIAQPNIETITEDEERSSSRPASMLSWTSGETNNETRSSSSSQEVTMDNLSEIFKKVAKAATDVPIKSAHTSIINDSIKPSTPKCTAVMRPHSQLYFSESILKSVAHNLIPPNCAGLPLAQQEQLVIDDLLYLFIGITGDYITPKLNEESENGFGPVQFEISNQIDISLRSIVEDILPIASHFSVVQKFAQWSAKVKNQILQALSEVLDTILSDYRVSVCQLEQEQLNGTLNLQKIFYLIRPNMQSLNNLAELVRKITQADATGGGILSLLFDEITLQTGDSNTQRILVELTDRAAEPYMEMLQLWILKGVIVDPGKQFFIIDHSKDLCSELLGMEDYDTACYWESRYAIEPARIPRFLEADADIILRTGKYLNVIRQCGKQITPPSGITKLQFSASHQHHSAFIKHAYHNASKTLLDLLMAENNLMGHISSVKRYFLLQQGDLITHFMDASEDELNKHVDKVTPVKLDNLLQLIVRLSSAKNDPCLEHLHCDLFTIDLVEQMSKIHVGGNLMVQSPHDKMDLTGLECFAFNYSVQWPISLVLNQWVLSQYQMLFRFLFYCKHVERQVCKVWIENNELSKTKFKSERYRWRSAFALRQRMLNAILQLENYMMIEIIEPNWHIFSQKMKNVQNIDEVMVIHQDFLHVCMQNCMLNYPDILEMVMKIIGSCLRFCKFIESEAGRTISAAWQKYVDEFSHEFNDSLIKLLQTINGMTAEAAAGSKLLNLVYRINFNGFYSEELIAQNNNIGE